MRNHRNPAACGNDADYLTYRAEIREIYLRWRYVDFWGAWAFSPKSGVVTAGQPPNLTVVAQPGNTTLGPLIANAPTDIMALLQEVHRLHQEIEALKRPPVEDPPPVECYGCGVQFNEKTRYFTTDEGIPHCEDCKPV